MRSRHYKDEPAFIYVTGVIWEGKRGDDPEPGELPI